MILAFVAVLLCSAANAAAATIHVGAGGDLQAALNAAQPGDTIELQAGATFTGPFVLPAKVAGAGNPEILIRTSTPDAQLPRGRRVTPGDAPKLAKLIAATGSVVRTSARAAHYRFVGIEIAPAPGVELVNVVLLGSEAWTETSVGELPHGITFDRVYIHADPVRGSRRGIALNGVDVRVVNSYISDFKQTCCDSQALAAWNSPGPFTIVNNYLEAAGENVMFGGADPSIANLVPSGIRIRNNHLAKPLRWKPDDPAFEGTNWVVKNLLELKNAHDAVIDGNILENNWADDQNGFAILFTPRNQDGASPWASVENVQFTNNEVRHALSAINILGWDNVHPSGQAKNIRIQNNIFWDIGGAQWGQGSAQAYGYGQGGWFLQLLDGTADVIVEHNAILETTGILNAGDASPAAAHTGSPHTGFVFRYNSVRHGTLGTGPAATVSNCIALSARFTSPTVTGNLLIGGPVVTCLSGNGRVNTEDDVGFVDWQTGDLRLAATSSFHGQAADGHDVGYDRVAFQTLGTTFADATLTAGVDSVRAIHVTELRRRIDDLRASYGLPPAVWTDASTAAAIIVKGVHLSEMRSALDAVYLAAGQTAPSYSDSQLVAGTTLIRASHVTELRAAVAALE